MTESLAIIDALEHLRELLSGHGLQTVAVGAGIMGLVAGALGCFAVLRQQSLLGDAISHASLPGVALVFLLFQTRAPLALVAGAIVAGWLGTILVMSVIRTTRVKTDGALGIMLSVFFGFGLVLLSYIQEQGGGQKAGLDRFLFGQAAAMVEEDLLIMSVFGFGALAITAMLWHPFKLVSFDAGLAATLGLRVRLLEVVLTSMIVVSIVIGLSTVGVVLMSALVVAPAAAARQWTHRLGVMVMLAGAIGCVSGVVGAVASAVEEGLPTGPAIVLVASGFVVVSLLFAPHRGVVWRRAHHLRQAKRFKLELVLCDLYELGSQHADRTHPHEVGAVASMSTRPLPARRGLLALARRGLAERLPTGAWSLTSEGIDAAVQVLESRAQLTAN